MGRKGLSRGRIGRWSLWQTKKTTKSVMTVQHWQPGVVTNVFFPFYFFIAFHDFYDVYILFRVELRGKAQQIRVANYKRTESVNLLSDCWIVKLRSHTNFGIVLRPGRCAPRPKNCGIYWMMRFQVWKYRTSRLAWSVKSRVSGHTCWWQKKLKWC